MTSQERNERPAGQPAGTSATTPQQQAGADVGGIPRTADSAIREGKQAPDRAPDVRPADRGVDTTQTDTAREASDGLAGTRGGPTAVPEQLGAKAAEDPPGQEDESPAESLGRAIGAPLSGEAAKHEPRR